MSTQLSQVIATVALEFTSVEVAAVGWWWLNKGREACKKNDSKLRQVSNIKTEDYKRKKKVEVTFWIRQGKKEGKHGENWKQI